MQISIPALALLTLLFASGSNVRAQALPSALPTGQPGTVQQTAVEADRATRQTPEHAQIHFDRGQLSIAANNSSLNEILNEVAARTGMIITGGVAEDRVYGVYGPADVGSVLMQMLDGTGTNMLLLEDASRNPIRLVLTARNGGATPPSPMSENYHRADRDLLMRSHVLQEPSRPSTATVPRGQPAAAPSSSQLTSAPSAPSVQPAPSVSPTATQESNSGRKTPQQVYEELLKLQKQVPADAPSAPH